MSRRNLQLNREMRLTMIAPRNPWLKRVSWSVANVLGAAVLILLIVDPHRPLVPIFGLLGVAVVLLFLPALLRW